MEKTEPKPPFKFVEVLVRGHSDWYPVFQDGAYLKGDVIVQMDGRRYWQPLEANDDRLPKSEKRRMWRHFDQFLYCRHMGDKNPWLMCEDELKEG